MVTHKKILMYCAFTALLTMIAGFVFVETAYPKVRSVVRYWVGLASAGPADVRWSDFRDPNARGAAQNKWHAIVQQKDSLFGPKTLHDFYAGWHKLEIWRHMYYLGARIQKYPTDLWVMQQIIYEVEPDYIVETGTYEGGSALYWAHILEGLELANSRVITVDIRDRTDVISKRQLWKKYVEFIHSSSTDTQTVAKIRERVKGKKVLVTLDSLHTSDHVLQELRLYSPLVSPGSYLVVEDTQLDGFPELPELGPGPMDAVNRFLAEGGNKLFEQDWDREALIISRNHGGWLRRKVN